MSEPKVGDHVRLIVEGFIELLDSRSMNIGDSWFNPADPHILSIEVIPKPFVLPTKQWAQVLSNTEKWGDFLFTKIHTTGADISTWRDEAGQWHSDDWILGLENPRVISEGVNE